MKSFNIAVLSFMGTALLFIAGCAKYQAKPLARISIPSAAKEDNTVTFSYKVFSKNDCLYYLDRDVIAKGYQPIHISICNNTNQAYSFSLDNIAIPCVDHDIVAQTVHTSTAKRAASYGVGALFLPILLVPAVVDGLGSSEANQQLDRDFEHKALKDQVINPYTTVNGLIFVSTKDAHQPVTIALTDIKNSQQLILASRDICTQV